MKRALFEILYFSGVQERKDRSEKVVDLNDDVLEFCDNSKMTEADCHRQI